MVISFELKAKKNIWWKNQKITFECPFEIIGLKWKQKVLKFRIVQRIVFKKLEILLNFCAK